MLTAASPKQIPSFRRKPLGITGNNWEFPLFQAQTAHSDHPEKFGSAHTDHEHHPKRPTRNSRQQEPTRARIPLSQRLPERRTHPPAGNP